MVPSFQGYVTVVLTASMKLISLIGTITISQNRLPSLRWRPQRVIGNADQVNAVVKMAGRDHSGPARWWSCCGGRRRWVLLRRLRLLLLGFGHDAELRPVLVNEFVGIDLVGVFRGPRSEAA